MEKQLPYHARIVDKIYNGDKKCYFLENENQKHYSKHEQIIENLKHVTNMNKLGFTINWPGDSIIADVKESGRGFDISTYDFITHDKTNNALFNGLCFADAEIIGQEAKFLRECSGNPTKYRNRWAKGSFFQDGFKQKHGFNL